MLTWSERPRMLPIWILGAAVTISSCTTSDTNSTIAPSDSTLVEFASPTDPLATSPPTSTADKDVPAAGEPQTEIVNILIDASTGVTESISVALGSPVNIRVVSDRSEEFHLHGYDLELSGTDVTFSFVADRRGDFELEGHESGRQLLILSVIED